MQLQCVATGGRCVATCNPMCVWVCVTLKTSHMDKQALSICPTRRGIHGCISRRRVPSALFAAVYCLLERAPLQQAHSRSAGTITPETQQWMMGKDGARDIHTLCLTGEREAWRLFKKSKCTTGNTWGGVGWGEHQLWLGLFPYSVKHTHMIFFFPSFLLHTPSSCRTQDQHLSIMWMRCRFLCVELVPCVHPRCCCCTRVLLLPGNSIPIASCSWGFNKKVND